MKGDRGESETFWQIKFKMMKRVQLTYS